MTPAEAQVDRLKTVVAVVGPIAIGIAAIFGWRDKHQQKAEMAAYPRYTIGTVTGSKYVVGPSPHTATFFTYEVNDSTYTSDITGSVPDGQTRCLLRFSARHPEYHEFYERVPIPDSIIQAPPAGWPALPFPAAAENME